MAYSGLALNPKPCDTSGLDANEAFARAHGWRHALIVRPPMAPFSKASPCRSAPGIPARFSPLLPKDSPMRFSTRLLACACLSGLASGCATFGTNVEGDFTCRAPKGGCAPTM
jgi:hypothetical protein